MTLFVLLRVKQHDDTPATHKQVHWGEHHLLPAPSPGSRDELHELHHKQKNCRKHIFKMGRFVYSDSNALRQPQPVTLICSSHQADVEQERCKKTNAGRSAPPANSEHSSILLFCLTQSCSPGASNTEATKHHKYK